MPLRKTADLNGGGVKGRITSSDGKSSVTLGGEKDPNSCAVLK